MANWNGLGRGNVDDRRGVGPAAIGGLGGVGIVIMLLFALFGNGGGSGTDVLDQLQTLQEITGQSSQNEPLNDGYQEFASGVLGSTDDFWTKQLGEDYEKPRLVLFRQATSSACGMATSSVGPHYCPPDKTIYLDETFFDALKNQLGAGGGDVAEAYVIAHEVGHHVQNLQGELSASRSNEASIATELQADCYAGAWLKSVSNILEPDEINEALDAAAAVGDDRIQQKTEGQIQPENWTHGSSQQRISSFNMGYSSGSPNSC